MKYIKYFFICFFLLPLSVFASNETYTRTMENPLVPKDVTVTENNLSDIMNTPAVNSDDKIYDFVDLYTDDQEKELYRRIKAYMSNSNIDVAIVTTNDLRGFNLDTYAYNFYDYNDFNYNGVVFVIYLGENNPEIFMGNSGDKTGKVFSTYTEDLIRQTLRYVYKDISSGNYYKATSDYITIIDGLYNIDNPRNDYVISEEGKIVRDIPWVEMVILSFALSFIAVILFVYKIRGNNRIRLKDDLAGKIDNDTLIVKTDMDDFVGTVISKKK